MDSDGGVEIQAVTKRYGSQLVLERASLDVARGQFVVVVGRSGSGKSTLLRLIGGLEEPDEGVVRVAGRDIGAMAEADRALLRRTTLGFVFQFFNLLPTLRVIENVELPLALNDVSRATARARSRALLDELGLAGCAERFPEELSGGEQQRVAIARAVVHEPKLVLADEPTGNLDLETATHVLDVLESTCRRRNATLIMATHGREIAARADRVVAISQAHIQAQTA